jgi:hypothetical protein
MRPADAKPPERAPADEPTLSPTETEMLARVRQVARQITERVAKALSDSDAHPTLPAEETPPRA